MNSEKVLPDVKNVYNFCARNLKASEILRDLIVLLRYFSKPISSFFDGNIRTFFLFSNSEFAKEQVMLVEIR